nr:palmitoyltransferase ZDHHC3-like [Cavia porcellus]
MSLRQALCKPLARVQRPGPRAVGDHVGGVAGRHCALAARAACCCPPRHEVYAAAHGGFFTLLAALGLVAHLRTALTDPDSVSLGSVPPGFLPDTDSNSNAEALDLCPCCGAMRPPRAYHCLVCRCCVRKMDHHCPWVNNCVGEDNQRHFVLFLLYITLASLHVLLLLGVPTLRSYARGEWDSDSTVMPDHLRLVLLILALMGFFLTTPMFFMQIFAICTDTTWVERIEGERSTGSRGSAWANLKAVFGSRVSLAWINPFATPPPQRAEGLHDVV